MADRIADEETESITLNRRFHRQLIGAGGENIKKLREQFPNTQINVPDENSKSDQITIRGPSKELKKAKVELQKKAKDIEERGYRVDVPILKEYHRNIIGKSGENIKKIREATNCQIELPKQDSDSEIITIIGRKADAEKARKMIRNIEKVPIRCKFQISVLYDIFKPNLARSVFSKYSKKSLLGNFKKLKL